MRYAAPARQGFAGVRSALASHHHSARNAHIRRFAPMRIRWSRAQEQSRLLRRVLSHRYDHPGLL